MTAHRSDPQRPPDRALAAIIAGAGLLALLVRIPTFFATRHLSFDDGVYGASAVAMRHGGVPFREVFSSQGPLFLVLVWLGDLLGLRMMDSPRLLAVVAGVITAAGSAAIAARISDGTAHARIAAAATGGLVATSGALWWTTGPLTSDGPTLALCVSAVWLAYSYRTKPTLGRALLIGVLLGAAVAVKVIMAAPAGLVCALLILSQRRTRHLMLAALPIGLIPLAVALPFGLSNVWEQVVRYRTENEIGSRNPIVHLGKLVTTLVDRDLPLTALLVVAGGALAVAAWQTTRSTKSDQAPWLTRLTTGLAPIGVWLLATIVVLAFQQPLWRNHVASIIPAMAIIIGVVFSRGGLPTLAMLTVGLLVAPYHLSQTRPMWNPQPYRGTEADIVALIAALPPESQTVSDDPGLVWRAGRRTPNDFVDASVLRVTTPIPGVAITTSTVLDAAARPEVCAVVATSPVRFGALQGLAPGLEALGYSSVLQTDDGHRVWVTSNCPGAGPTRR